MTKKLNKKAWQKQEKLELTPEELERQLKIKHLQDITNIQGYCEDYPNLVY